MKEVTLKSVMQGMKDIDRLKHLQCDCKGVDFGTHEASVWVLNPFIPKFPKSITTLDVCILAEVIFLWNQGIETTESCCGHNKTHGYIAVSDEYVSTMKDLGYIQFKPNCFYRRGNWWLNNTMVYFIERVKDNKWLQHATVEGEWTNDPVKAMKWKTKEGAYRFLNDSQNEPHWDDWSLLNGELIVTEHEFVNESA